MEDEASSHEDFCVAVLREQARSDRLAMVSWSGQPLVETTNDYEQVQFHDRVFYVTSDSLLLQALQREQETYEKMSSWTSDKVIKHFSTSIITGATADALASDENISWGLYANVSEDELTKTVAHALLLRPECLAVRIRGEGDVMTTCPAASRRIVLRYNAGGELADYVDHFAWDVGFASMQLDTPDAAGDRLVLIYVYAPSILHSYPAVRLDFCVTRTARQVSEPTDLQLEAYPADGEMQGEHPARRRRLRGKQVDPRNHPADDPVADRGHGELENEGANQNDGDIGVKPEGITMAQWGVLRKLHLNLGHPTAASLN